MLRKYLAVLLLVGIVFQGASCSVSSSDLTDGYYVAELERFDEDGWKEYISIYVTGGKIVTVEYDARNSSGFLRSWDMSYMRKMTAETGTYPSAYARAYSVSLINWQTPTNVLVVTGAEESYRSFILLAEAAIARSRAGDKSVAIVAAEGS